MEKIEELGKSRKVKDQLKALELFEERYSKLPFGRAREFIEKKRKSKNKKVSEKAEEVYSKTVKERWDKISENMKIITGSTVDALQKLAPKLHMVSNNFLISKEVLERINESINSPIIELNRKIEEQHVKPFLKMMEMIESQVFPIKYPSPILTTSFYVEPLVKRKRSTSTLSQVLDKEPKEMQRELKGAIKSEKDIFFNHDAYNALSKIERFLRSIIQKRIIEPYSDILQNKIHPRILEKWKERKGEEERNKLVDNGYSLIEYSDFTDLKAIFEKGKNLDLFSDIANKEELKGLVAKLHELDPIRKKIAHFRPLSKREFDKLIMYAEDIDRIFKKK